MYLNFRYKMLLVEVCPRSCRGYAYTKRQSLFIWNCSVNWVSHVLSDSAACAYLRVQVLGRESAYTCLSAKPLKEGLRGSRTSQSRKRFHQRPRKLHGAIPSIYYAYLLAFRQRSIWSLRSMMINLFTIFVTILHITIGHSNNHKPHDYQRVTCCLIPLSFQPVHISQVPKVIHALPLLLINKQLLSDTTDANRPA